jgi:hypothetical protein
MARCKTLLEQGHRVCIVDVSMVLKGVRPVNGLHVTGWGTHDFIIHGAWPGDLWRRLVLEFGRPAMPPEHLGLQTPHSLLALREALLRSTEETAADRPGAARARAMGPLLSDLRRGTQGGALPLRSLPDRHAGLSESARRTLEGALHAIYEAVGVAVAQLIEQTPADACIIVFAVHGMGPNPGWCELVPEIIARMQHVRGQGGKRRLLYALERRLPFHWVRPVLKHLPEGLRYALVSAWSRRMFNGRTTRYFPIPMSSSGYLRLNLRGREAEGIVSLGAEYDELCAELETAFRSLRDRETLAPIASAIHGAYRDARDAPRRQFLPDLLIKWTGPHRFAVERLDLRDARRHRCIEPPALRPLRQSCRSRLVHQRRPRDRYGHLGRKFFHPRSRADRLSLARCRALAEVPWQAINAIYP